ncbi:hypothetical protein BASA81_003505 [Batrachochytrium salamandrivorans]|nr:hypothetical protein BASA81_003505 [Batrachochytrium salamandrivorans]
MYTRQVVLRRALNVVVHTALLKPALRDDVFHMIRQTRRHHRCLHRATQPDSFAGRLWLKKDKVAGCSEIGEQLGACLLVPSCHHLALFVHEFEEADQVLHEVELECSRWNSRSFCLRVSVAGLHRLPLVSWCSLSSQSTFMMLTTRCSVTKGSLTPFSKQESRYSFKNCNAWTVMGRVDNVEDGSL